MSAQICVKIVSPVTPGPHDLLVTSIVDGMTNGAFDPVLAFVYGTGVLNTMGTPYVVSYGVDDFTNHRSYASNDVSQFGLKLVGLALSGQYSVLRYQSSAAFGGVITRKGYFDSHAVGQANLHFVQNDVIGDSFVVVFFGGDCQGLAGFQTFNPQGGYPFQPASLGFLGGTGQTGGTGTGQGGCLTALSVATSPANEGVVEALVFPFSAGGGNTRTQDTTRILVGGPSVVSLDPAGFTLSSDSGATLWAIGGVLSASGTLLQPPTPQVQKTLTGIKVRGLLLLSNGAEAGSGNLNDYALFTVGASDGVRQAGFMTGESATTAALLGANIVRNDRLLMFPSSFAGAGTTFSGEAALAAFTDADGSFSLNWLLSDGVARLSLWIVWGEALTPPPPPPPPPVIASNTLILDVKAKRWFFDQYDDGVITRLWAPGEEVHEAILGHVDGEVSLWGANGDNGNPIDWLIQVPDWDGGDARREKVYGDLYLKADPQGSTGGITVTPVFNDSSSALPATIIGAGETGEKSYIVDVNAGYGQLAKNLGLQIAGTDLVRPIVFLWEPAVLPKVETTRLRATDWDSAGRIGAKFMQGVRIIADTEGQAVPVRIEFDGGQLGASLIVNENGEDVSPLSFPTPFIGHLVRIVPTDPTKTWRFYVAEWVWEPAPDLVAVWETQPTTLDLPGYHHEERALVGYMSSTDAQLIITCDNQQFIYALPNSSNRYVKLEILEAPNKSKVSSYRIETVTGLPGIRVFQRDLEIRVKGWGMPGPYQSFRPFGDESRVSGARI